MSVIIEARQEAWEVIRSVRKGETARLTIAADKKEDVEKSLQAGKNVLELWDFKRGFATPGSDTEIFVLTAKKDLRRSDKEWLEDRFSQAIIRADVFPAGFGETDPREDGK